MPIDWHKHTVNFAETKQSQTEVYKQTRDFARFYQQIERDINARE